MKKNRVRVRFAPSPTGSLHIGGLRTALYNYLFAKQHGGDFILRIEDTDQSRKVEGAFEELVETLHAYAIDPDEGPAYQEDGSIEEFGSFGPYIQSQRLGIYRKAVEKLLANGFAYRSFETAEELERMREIQKRKGLPPRYDGKDRDCSQQESDQRAEKGEPFVIRLKMPKTGTCVFNDLVRGKVSFSYKDIDDQILLKSDSFPTYHLANVVDDHEMRITHVIRGEEWLPSTPKHLFLYEAFGWEPPQFAHLPVLLDPKGGKLSKRSGAARAKDLLTQGYLPDAVINFILLLGWNPKTEKEIFSRKEMIAHFSLESVHSAGAVVNKDKLDWMNREFLKTFQAKPLTSYCLDHGFLPKSKTDRMTDDDWYDFLDLVKERITTLADVAEHVDYFFNEPQFDTELLLQKRIKEDVLKTLQAVILILEKTAPWTFKTIQNQLEAWQKETKVKRGDVLWPIRVALSGKKFSPGAYELLALFPQETVLRRIQRACQSLSKKT